ncbi:hypothetical protein Taro_039545 [Colocasia esculenta]|uniref:Uncharacterized protein n=1 Tax=Colocasia esculenta TaxID=4460 RepID=A0A843WGW4_COLES|nr:hypothetical protein [Colocasia esculenta]
MSSWCGWHTDHGSLTGLTSGVFTRNAVQVSCPDHAAGLYVKTRNNETVKAPNGQEAFGLERSTFALFMQPDWEQVLRFPKEVHLHQELIPPGRTLTFGEYSEMLLNKYYHHR